MSSAEIKSELETIFDNIIENKWLRYSDPYFDLCEYILSDSMYAATLIRILPQRVIDVFDLFWLSCAEDLDFPYERNEPNCYGLYENLPDKYSSASALISPSFWLFQCYFWKTIDYMIGFTNKAIKTYAENYPDNVEQESLTIEGEVYTQWSNPNLWLMYRGAMINNEPEILQSIHMALEKYLLQAGETVGSAALEAVLLHILKKSQ